MCFHQWFDSSKEGRVDVVRELLNDGADIEFKDRVLPMCNACIVEERGGGGDAAVSGREC